LNNSSVSYLKAGDGQNALDAVISVDEVFKIAGDLKRQAMTLGNQAAALDNLDRVDEALIKFIESADLFASIGENELRAYVCQSISAMQLRNGRYLEAYATMQSGDMGVKNPNLTQKILKSLMDVPFKFLQ
jgi:hypothetical protein